MSHRNGSDPRVLVVEDDRAVGKVLCGLLEQDGLGARWAGSADEALGLLEEHPFDLVITDLRMPGMDGMALLTEIGRRWVGLPVVMLTAHGTVPLAVEAMKAGAAEFLLKPFDRQEVLFVARKLLVAARGRVESPPEIVAGPSGMVGDSPPLRELLAMVDRAAASSATVLLRGESGTGKELVALAIHERGPRRGGPLIAVHCAALPETLLESELFGHEKGAFTGAVARKPGRIELADQGTLFLDEIGEISPLVQVKLLRVLQERRFERLGGTQVQSVDVRVVAATHRDLEAMMAHGEFREDLYYRLNVIPIWIPPLRERGDDLELLARHFCRVHGAANGKPALTLEPEAIARLRTEPWPGNIRQLQNFVERLVVLSDGPRLRASDVERELDRHAGPLGRAPGRDPAAAAAVVAGSAPPSLDSCRLVAEREAILDALRRCGNNRTKAARVLGVSRRTLYNKLEECGLL
jgi:two-component system, NtrC family, response regulator AtoC